MTDFFKRKPIVASLIIIIVGAAIIGGMFIYYGLNLGVKPCEGLPTDAQNCGDGDFGGVYFIMIGAPIALFGVASLVNALFQNFRNRTR